MKKYLKTPEEVIDALRDGKEIFDNLNNKYKLIDGFVTNRIKGGGWGLNYYIGDTDGLYVEESEPLKLEVGKFYKTRDGRKAIVLNVVKDDTRSCPVRVVVVDNTYEPYFVRKSGRLYKNEENAWDIVAPWEE